MRGGKKASSSALIRAIAVAEKALLGRPWPPDVFASLFDILSVDKIWRHVQHEFINAARDYWLLEPSEVRFRTEVAPQIKAASLLTDALIRRTQAALTEARKWAENNPPSDIAAERFVREIAWSARAIDVALSQLSVYAGSSIPDYLQEFWDQLASEGTLTKQATGRVIPRVAHCSYGNSLGQFFGNVLRIPSDSDRDVDYRIISTGDRIVPYKKLRVGFVPVALLKDEVVWRKDKNLFTVRLNPRKKAAIIERTLKAMSWLIDKRVDVVLLPELVSSASLRDRISEFLRSCSGHRPFLVIAGSEAVSSSSPTGKTNRAFVLDGMGQLLWTPEKCHQFALTKKAIESFSLQSELGSRPLNESGTSAKEEIAIRDISGKGRFCVLICEDLARADPGPKAMRSFGVDACLVVVMNGRYDEAGWIKRCSLALVQEPGLRIAVGNSHALLARIKHTAESKDLAYYFLPDQLVSGDEQLLDDDTGVIAAVLRFPD